MNHRSTFTARIGVCLTTLALLTPMPQNATAAEPEDSVTPRTNGPSTDDVSWKEARLIATLNVGFNTRAEVGGEFGQELTMTSGVGANLRVDVPVLQYLTLGPALQIRSWKAEVPAFYSRTHVILDAGRQQWVGLGIGVRGRFPFRFRNPKVSAELYLGVVPAIIFAAGGAVSQTLNDAHGFNAVMFNDRFGVGVGISVLPGFQVMFRNKVGFVFEIGPSWQKVKFKNETVSVYGERNNLEWTPKAKQVAINLGFVVGL